MVSMAKKYVTWFICFGLSFLVSDVFGWTEQGKAFLYIHLGIVVVIILVIVVMIIIPGVESRGFNSGKLSLLIFLTIGAIAFILLATWGATKLFAVDFYVAYQIMTFGMCLCATESNKDHKDKKE